MIKSTLWFDDIGVVPGLLPASLAVQRSCMRSRKWSGRRPGNEASCAYFIAEAIHLQAVGRYTELIITAGQRTNVRLLMRNVFSRYLLSGQNGRTQTVWA